MKTLFEVPIEVAFDGERNLSLHSATQQHRGERAVGGVTSGLIEKGQEVEWEAVHFKIRQRLRVRITEMEKPVYFRDEQIRGAFKKLSHEHRFKRLGENQTEKLDILEFTAPLGLLGRLAEILFLKRYMTAFLKHKNQALKQILEK